MEPVFDITDITAAAWLALKFDDPTLIRKDSGLVIFQFPKTPELVASLGRFHANETIGVRDYANKIKSLRARMILLRNDY